MSTRRLVLTSTAAVIGAASTGLRLPEMSRAQSGKHAAHKDGLSHLAHEHRSRSRCRVERRAHLGARHGLPPYRTRNSSVTAQRNTV